MLEGGRRFPTSGVALEADVRRSCTAGRWRAKCVQTAALEWLTLFVMASTVKKRQMGVRKIPIGQSWRKTDTGAVSLVSRVYRGTCGSSVVLWRSAADAEAMTRLRAKNSPKGPCIARY